VTPNNQPHIQSLLNIQNKIAIWNN